MFSAMLEHTYLICIMTAPLGGRLLTCPPAYKMSGHNEGESTHVHILSVRLHYALPESSITDIQLHRVLILTLCFAWQNSMSLNN